MIRFRSLLALGAGVMVAASALNAQSARAAVPFGVGEAMSYDVKYGALNVGTGRMFVVGIDTVRSQPAWHLRLELNAGIIGFRVVNVLESWMDVTSLSALRYRQDTKQGGKDDRREAEIYPDQKVYTEKDWRKRDGKTQEIDRGEHPTVAQPLDQASFLFFARTQPLEVGQTYSYDRYYKPQSNPVTLAVLRREEVTVPAGKFKCIVVRPTFKSNGIFGQNGRAEVWFTDDDRRLMVKMATQVAFGSITLQLKEFQGSGVEP